MLLQRNVNQTSVIFKTKKRKPQSEHNFRIVYASALVPVWLHESGSKIKLLMRWDVSASGLSVLGIKAAF